MKTDMIKLEDLVVGTRYSGAGRNFDEGVWNGTGFVGTRYSMFGTTFEDEELHWETDPKYGTFKPFEALKDDS